MKYNPEYVIKISTQQNWRDRERAIREISKFKSILKEYYEAALENKLRSMEKNN